MMQLDLPRAEPNERRRERRPGGVANSSIDPARIAILTGRVPLLPARVARDLFDSQDPLGATRDLLHESPLFDAAVFLASKSLHDALEPWHRGQEPKKKRAPLKALSYALRMSTRSTPFGLFAGTGPVARGPSSALGLAARPAQLFASCDAAWLGQFYTQLEREPAVRLHLPVVANDLVLVRGERAYVRHPERLRRGLDAVDSAVLHYEPLTVRWTQTLSAVMALAAVELPLQDLQLALCERLGMRPGVASELTERLLEIGCLVFTRPLGAEPLPELSASLREPAGRTAREIDALSCALRALNMRADAVTRTRLSEVSTAAAALQSGGATPLQVNVITSFSGTLGERVLADVARLGSLMMANARPRRLTEYRTKFIERYEGDSRRVPLLELTDPEVGIGAPHDPMDIPETPDATLDGMRMRLVARALRGRSTHVTIDAKELLALHGAGELAAAPHNGFEIGFQISASDVRAIERGEYSMRPVYGLNTDGPFKTVHRFARAMNVDVTALDRSAVNDPGAALPVELIFEPHDAHYGNLLQMPQNGYVVAGRRERLPEGLNRIEPRDIVIGLEGTRFVAYSSSEKRRLLVRESYMLQVPYFGSPHIRLLSMIGKQDHVLPQLLGWGRFGSMPFTPRLQHERLVLAVARWTLSRRELEAERSDLASFISRWRHEWNVPRYIYLVERDLKLLLDLDSPISVRLIGDQIGTPSDGYPAGSIITFEEMFPDFEHLWLLKNGERYLHEFVAGIVAQERPPAALAPRLARDQDAKHGPGGNWTYAKIYCPAAEMDIVLRSVASLVSSLAGTDVDRWFFLRYADPQPHIRLRIHSEVNASRVLLAVTARLGEMLAQGTIARYALDTYEPELQRYGGAEALSLAEILFDEDSRRVSGLLRAGTLPWEPRLMESFAFILAFLEEWFAHFGRSRWLQAQASAARAVKTVKWPHVRKLRDMLGTQSLPSRSCAAIAGLAQLEHNGTLAVDSVELCASLLHMHFNRIGIPMQAEANVLATVWHALNGKEREAASR